MWCCLQGQYYTCWCPVGIRQQGISRYNIDQRSRNILGKIPYNSTDCSKFEASDTAIRSFPYENSATNFPCKLLYNKPISCEHCTRDIPGAPTVTTVNISHKSVPLYAPYTLSSLYAMYRKKSSSWCSWYKAPIVALVGGITLFTKKNSASSGRKWIRFRIKK